ncbi:hypothetical protein B0T14DRAFT_15726 [Immersiella caudata]|uniref:Uncharacterized protein n=1 Tax=Immersiella caudata TaxID=314043 RepID=A0AA39XEX5_9PEZI|nr:hypothetical protein B0T14DRAFT_15726 [Immersiella caudata]
MTISPISFPQVSFEIETHRVHPGKSGELEQGDDRLYECGCRGSYVKGFPWVYPSLEPRRQLQVGNTQQLNQEPGTRNRLFYLPYPCKCGVFDLVANFSRVGIHSRSTGSSTPARSSDMVVELSFLLPLTCPSCSSLALTPLRSRLRLVCFLRGGCHRQSRCSGRTRRIRRWLWCARVRRCEMLWLLLTYTLASDLLTQSLLPSHITNLHSCHPRTRKEAERLDATRCHDGKTFYTG